MRWLYVLFVIAVLMVVFVPVEVSRSVDMVVGGWSRKYYALYLMPTLQYDVYGRFKLPGYYEKFIVGMPWVFRAWRDTASASDKATYDDFFPGGQPVPVIFAVGKPGAYSIDDNVYRYLRWAVGNGSVLICNNFFAAVISEIANVTAYIEYEATGNWTVEAINGTTMWIALSSSYPRYLIKLRGWPGDSTVYAWIEFEDGVHPLVFARSYGSGYIVVYPQYGYKPMQLESLIINVIKEYVWRGAPFINYGWVNGRVMVALRLDDLFPYMDSGAEKFSILRFLVDNIAKKYNVTIMVGATALGREFQAVYVYDGLPEGYVFSGEYDGLRHGVISKVNLTFIIYDRDGDGKVDTIRYDLDHDGSFDDEDEYTLGEVKPVNVTYEGFLYKIVPYTTNSLTSPLLVKFGLINDITYQYNETYLTSVNEWIREGYIQVIRHGWNHWSAGFNYAVEFYKPFSNDVYSSSEIEVFFNQSLDVLSHVFDDVIVGGEIRPFGGYTRYPGDDENFYSALRKLGIVSLSTSSLAVFDILNDVRMDGAIYVDKYKDDVGKIHRVMDWLALRGEPINVFSHPTNSLTMTYFKYYIWYARNNTDKFIIVRPDVFINMYRKRLNILGSPWLVSLERHKRVSGTYSEYYTELTIRLPDWYDGMVILLDEDYYGSISGGVFNGTMNGKHVVLVKNSTIRIVLERRIESEIYGGSEILYDSAITGLVVNRTVDSRWINLGSYDSVLVQFSGGIFFAGFYEGGNYEVVGYVFDGQAGKIYSARFVVSANGLLVSVKHVYQELYLEYVPTTMQYVKLIFYRGNVLAMVLYQGQWYTLRASMNITTVNYMVVNGAVNHILVMRGDYLRFRDDNLIAVSFSGIDALGNKVNFTVGDNGPSDADTETNSIMVQELPVIYPITGNLTFHYKKDEGLGLNYTFPRIERGQWVNISFSYVNTSMNNINTSLVNAVINILKYPHGRIILGLLPVLLMLYPNRKYGAIMGIFAVALLGFFNVVAFANGLDPIIDPRALVLSFIVLAFGLLYEVK